MLTHWENKKFLILRNDYGLVSPLIFPTLHEIKLKSQKSDLIFGVISFITVNCFILVTKENVG